ncbi:MAG: PKD domain-containing protein [Bacteroidia bacterium]|nr:PKD domain-containing protein [Bacteroidia bacterium]MDW8302280.1 PKD domain-containing protein [Bacteroidia bacterium]
MEKKIVWICVAILVFFIRSRAQTFSFPAGSINNNSILCVQTNVTGLATPSPTFGLEKVILNINHSAVQELKITLKNPRGDIIHLLRYNEASGANLTNTTFQKGLSGIPTINTGTAPYTGVFRIMPPDSLGTMNITPDLNGIWELCIKDTALVGNVSGFLISASLVFGSQPAIPPRCIANFTATPIVGCAPLMVQFQDLSQYATTVKYDFGDANSSTTKNPTHTYTTPGTYTVTQSLTQNGFSTDTLKKINYIIVKEPKPQANFVVDEFFCTPATVNVLNTSLFGASFEWDFGNGNVSNLASPEPVSYNAPGEYTIRLIAFNSAGCSDTVIKKIKVIPTPNAAFDLSAKKGCAPFTVAFTNNSTLADAFEWNFGDGYTSTVSNPTHTYTSAGKYKITLKATNQTCMNTFVDSIEIFNPPTVDFTASPTYVNISAGDNATITFIASTSGPGTVLWNFGDGNTSSLLNPVHTYLEGGRYTVSLTFTDSLSGCVAVTTKKEYIFVDMQENIFVPTAFSPNGDGNNDFFEIKTSGVYQVKVLIFNRWGQKVFESEGNTTFWSGENAPEGVYSYVVTCKGIITGRTLQKVGTVTLIR